MSVIAVDVATDVLKGPLGALVAGVMLFAGLAKLVAPHAVTRAIGELLPGVRGHALILARTLAVTEITTASLLSFPRSATAGAAGGALLGALFATAGGLGAASKQASPCGCFGRTGTTPLGLRHMYLGFILASVSVWLLLSDGTGWWAKQPGLSTLGTSTVAVLLSLWMNRDMVSDLVSQLDRPPRRRTTMIESGRQ